MTFKKQRSPSHQCYGKEKHQASPYAKHKDHSSVKTSSSSHMPSAVPSQNTSDPRHRLTSLSMAS